MQNHDLLNLLDGGKTFIGTNPVDRSFEGAFSTVCACYMLRDNIFLKRSVHI